MNKYLINSIILVLVISTSLINYKALQSSFLQGFLIQDFNEQKFRVPIYEIKKLDDNFPSISATLIPIKALKARYYYQMDSIDKAIELNKTSIKDNPYIKVPEAQLANIYFDIKEFDSSYVYAKDAFQYIPNNNFHRDIYFKNLVIRGDTNQLRDSFKKIKNSNSSHWIDYINSRYFIVGPKDSEILNLLNEFSDRFPQYINDKRYIVLKNIITSGELNVNIAANLVEQGNLNYDSKNYKDAIQFYEAALEFDKGDYIIYENAAITYNNLENYKKAYEYFDKVIYELKSIDGKSEYLKALMLIKLDSLDQGCRYLIKANEKRYGGSGTVDVYNRFCR